MPFSEEMSDWLGASRLMNTEQGGNVTGGKGRAAGRGTAEIDFIAPLTNVGVECHPLLLGLSPNHAFIETKRSVSKQYRKNQQSIFF